MSLPTEVSKMRDNNMYDTVLVIKTENNTYYFNNKSKELINKETRNPPFGVQVLVFLCLILLVILIFL